MQGGNRVGFSGQFRGWLHKPAGVAILNLEFTGLACLSPVDSQSDTLGMVFGLAMAECCVCRAW